MEITDHSHMKIHFYFSEDFASTAQLSRLKEDRLKNLCLSERKIANRKKNLILWDTEMILILRNTYVSVIISVITTAQFIIMLYDNNNI